MAKTKLKKDQIIEGIRLIGQQLALSVEAQGLIDYTLDNYDENARNVTMDDVKEAIGHIEDSTEMKFMEALKKAQDLLIEEEEAKVEDKTKEVTEKSKVLPKAKPTQQVENEKKPPVVKKETKPEEVKETKETKSTKKANKPHQEYLASFPEILESKSLKAKLKLRKDLVSIKDVVKAYNSEQDLVIATYWTKKLLKQYATGYDPMNINPNRPKEFEHDLDLIEITYAHDLVVTGCSLYSIVPQVLLPEDFEQDEEGMRYANGCEFQVYEVMDEDAE